VALAFYELKKCHRESIELSLDNMKDRTLSYA